MSNLELDDLRQRLGNVIRDYCNTIGCKNCPLSWQNEDESTSCSATELDGKIMDLELGATK